MWIFNRTSRAFAFGIQYFFATFLLAMSSMMIGKEKLFQTEHRTRQHSHREHSLRMLGQYTHTMLKPLQKSKMRRTRPSGRFLICPIYFGFQVVTR